MVTEEGLYEILMLSRKKAAKVFKKGVKQVLKSLRLNGGYIVGQQSINKDDFEKAVAERANCVVSSIQKELNFWRGVAQGQQAEIDDLRDRLYQLGY